MTDQPVFRIIKPEAGKRRFTFEVDVTENMKDINFICYCQARVKSEKIKHLIEVVTLPVTFVEQEMK